MENRDSESNKNPESKSTLGVIDKIGFSFGHILNDLTAGLWFSYTLLYLKSIVELPHFWAGFLMMLGQVFDAASTCIVGILTDKFNSKRIWHIFGTFLVIISFPLIFIKLSVLNDEDSLTWKISYYAFWIFIFQFGWPICQICHLAMIPELSLSEKDRIELTSYKYLFSIISNMLLFVITWIVLHVKHRSRNIIGPEDYEKFKEIIIFLICIGIVMSVLFQYALSLSNYDDRCILNISKHKEAQARAQHQQRTENTLYTKHIYRSLHLYENALLYMFSRVFVVTSLCYIPLWLNERFSQFKDENVEQIAFIPLVVYIGSFSAVFAVKLLNQNVNQKIIYIYGSIFIIIACFWIQFSRYKISEIIAISVLIGFGSSSTQVSSLCIIANMIGDNTLQGGTIYSVVTFFDKLVTGIVIILIEINENGSKDYYKTTLVFSGISAILGLMVILFFRCLRKTKNIIVTVG